MSVIPLQSPDSCLTHYTVAGGRSVAYTVLVLSLLNAPVELSSRYTSTPLQTLTIEIGSTSATVK